MLDRQEVVEALQALDVEEVTYYECGRAAPIELLNERESLQTNLALYDMLCPHGKEPCEYQELLEAVMAERDELAAGGEYVVVRCVEDAAKIARGV